MTSQTLSESTQLPSSRLSGSSFFLTQPLAHAASSRPDRYQTRQGVPISNEHLWQCVLKIATWLQRNGVEPQCVVLLALSEDHPFTDLIAMAATHVGGIVSVLPKGISKSRFTAIANRCEPACVFLDEGTATFRSSIEGILTVWMTPGLSGGDWDEAELSEVLQTKAAWGLPFPGKADDPALLVFDQSEDIQGRTWTHNHLQSLMLDQPETFHAMLTAG